MSGITLEEIVRHELFPEVDIMLRRGRHIDADDGSRFLFLREAYEHLYEFYKRFGCELVTHTDSFYYLISNGDLVGKRLLSAGEMVVGQALALLYLSPASVEHAGTISREQLMSHLSGVLGHATLIRVLNPQRKKIDERIAEQEARERVLTALRRLSTLGFVDLIGAEQLGLRSSLGRFIDPVRSLQSPEAALAKLIARGEATTDVAVDSEEEEGGAE